jgi:hypothetical protein
MYQISCYEELKKIGLNDLAITRILISLLGDIEESYGYDYDTTILCRTKEDILRICNVSATDFNNHINNINKNIEFDELIKYISDLEIKDINQCQILKMSKNKLKLKIKASKNNIIKIRETFSLRMNCGIIKIRELVDTYSIKI